MVRYRVAKVRKRIKVLLRAWKNDYLPDVQIVGLNSHKPTKSGIPYGGLYTYLIVGADDKGRIVIVYPFGYVQAGKITKQTFEKSLVYQFWPVNTSGVEFNTDTFTNAILRNMKSLSERGKSYPEKLLRTAIAVIKRVALDSVPKYSSPSTALVKKLGKTPDWGFLDEYQKKIAMFLVKSKPARPKLSKAERQNKKDAKRLAAKSRLKKAKAKRLKKRRKAYGKKR